MEGPPYRFQAITNFSVARVESHSPRIDGIKTLTLEIGSKIPPGAYPLLLIKPFPPLGRPGDKLDRLASLHAQEIESISVFRKPHDEQWARIEIRGKPPGMSIIVRCDAIEGVPGWDEATP